MKFLKNVVLATALSLAASAPAQATWFAGEYLTTGAPFNHTFHVAQQQDMKISQATLSLWVSDQTDFWWGSETLTVKADNKPVGTIENVGHFGEKHVYDLLPSLFNDGKLDLSLSLGCNSHGRSGKCGIQDIWLHKVLLEITRVPVTPAPAPAPAIPAPTVPAPAAPAPAAPAPVESDPNPPLATAPVPPTVVDPVSPLPGELPVDSDTVPATPAEVPEPATLLTLGAGLLGLAFMRRRRV